MMPNLEEAYEGLSGRGGKLRTSRPENGYLAYLWRMVKFHGGVDVTMPVTCFFHLQNQLEKDGEKANVCGVIDGRGKEILDKLDGMVDLLCVLFGLSPYKAVQAWKGLFI